MIEEIKNLRKKGLSFRKIAEELDTTIGKVQYQWKKYKKIEETKPAEQKRQFKFTIKQSIHRRLLNKKKLVQAEKEYLTAWILSENKLFIYWRLLDLKKDLVSSYFNKPFNSFQMVLRIYDTSHILFDGSNAPHVQEVKLQEGQIVSLLRELDSNRCYISEIGVYVADHKFFPLLRSNAVHMPKSDRDRIQQQNEADSKKDTTFPEWVEHVSTYSYYESILKKDDM